MAKTVDDIMRDGSLAQHLHTIAAMNHAVAAIDDAKFMDLMVRSSINGKPTAIYLPLPDCSPVVNAVRYFLEQRAAAARMRISAITNELSPPPPTQPERTDDGSVK